MPSNFVLEFLHRRPRLKDGIFAALSKAHLIFLDYPPRSKPRYGFGKPPHPKLYAIIDRNREAYREQLELFLQFRDALTQIPKEVSSGDTTEATWINRWLPGLDGVALYGILRLCCAQRYFEIGSGVSTKFARRASDDGSSRTRIVSVDPYPRDEIDSICAGVIRQPIEDVDLAVFDELEAGDVLFVDNSHRVFMNSDATVVFLDVFPRLKSGVIVGFHDIQLPYDYPEVWKYRYYSEQYLLAAYLLAEGNRFDIVLPCAFVREDPELSAILAPLWEDERMEGVSRYGSTFWIRVR